MHTYIHTYIYTYIHTYHVHIQIHTQIRHGAEDAQDVQPRAMHRCRGHATHHWCILRCGCTCSSRTASWHRTPKSCSALAANAGSSGRAAYCIYTDIFVCVRVCVCVCVCVHIYINIYIHTHCTKEPAPRVRADSSIAVGRRSIAQHYQDVRACAKVVITRTKYTYIPAPR